MIASALSRHPDGSSIGARRRLPVKVDCSAAACLRKSTGKFKEFSCVERRAHKVLGATMLINGV